MLTPAAILLIIMSAAIAVGAVGLTWDRRERLRFEAKRARAGRQADLYGRAGLTGAARRGRLP